MLLQPPVELDWERLEKCPAVGPVKISIKQVGNKFAMGLHIVYRLFFCCSNWLCCPVGKRVEKKSIFTTHYALGRPDWKFPFASLQQCRALWWKYFLLLVELYPKSCEAVTLFVPVSQASCRIMLCHAYNLTLKRRRLQRGQNTLEGSPLSEPSLSVCLLISWALVWLLVYWQNKNNLIFLHES